MKDIKELISGLLEKRNITVYKGTIKDDTLEFWKAAKKERDRANEVFLVNKEEFWKRVYAELNLEPDKNYHVEALTGQVFESVPVGECKDDSGREEAEHEVTEANPV